MITSAIALSDLYFYDKILGKYRKTEKNRLKLPMMIFRRNTANIFNQNFCLDITIKFYLNNQSTTYSIITKTAQDIKRLFSSVWTKKHISQLILLPTFIKSVQNIFTIRKSIHYQTTRKTELYSSYFQKKWMMRFEEFHHNNSLLQADQQSEAISFIGTHDIFSFKLKEPEVYSPDLIENKSMKFGKYHSKNFFLQSNLELKIPDLISQARMHDTFPLKRKEPDFYSPDIPMKRSIIFNNYYYFIKMLYQNSLKLKNKDVLSYSSQNIIFDLNGVHQPLYSSGKSGINLYINDQIPGNINFRQTMNNQTNNMHEYASVLKRTSPHLNMLPKYNALSVNNQQFNIYNNRTIPDKPFMTHYYYNPGSANVIINPGRTTFQTDGKNLHYHSQQKIEQEIEQIKKTINKTKEEMENQSQSTSIPDDADIKKQFDIGQISDQVYQVIEQKIRIEKEQRGF